MPVDTYCGWTNRETWACNLWLSNCELLYGLTNESVRQGLRDGEHLSDVMKGHVKALFELDVAPDGMREEVGSLWRVDWDALAEAWMPEGVEA